MEGTPTPGSIVVGLDPSSDARMALDWAATRAAALGAPLHLVAARSPETDDGWDHDHVDHRSVAQLHQGLLEQARAQALRAQPGLVVTGAASSRFPAAALVLAARQARMIVLGSHGEAMLRWSLGSTAHQVAVHAPCTVAVVRQDRDPSFGRVLVGLDDAAHAQPLDWAVTEASRTGAEVLAVHVHAREDDVAAQAGKTAASPPADFLAGASTRVGEADPQVKIRTDVVTGRPIRSLLQLTRDSDVVVLGARGRGGFPQLTLGHVAGSVLQRADCTVVITR